jgi:hypothetical protein
LQQQAAEAAGQPKREDQPVLLALAALAGCLMVVALRAAPVELVRLHCFRLEVVEAADVVLLAWAEMATTVCATLRAVLLVLDLRLEGP